jgi:dTDP-4-amino-4,6-dideoxygalactose transaminase
LAIPQRCDDHNLALQVARLSSSRSRIVHIEWKEQDVELRIPTSEGSALLGFEPGGLEEGLRTIEWYRRGLQVIRLATPDIDESEVAAAGNALRSGQLVQARRVAEFEDLLRALTGAPHVAAVSNGTAALHLALLALGIQRGDKVAVTTFSWPATANVIELCQAVPVFVDIEEHTYGMDPARLELVLSRDSGIRAVMPVHAFGGMAEMRQICEIADRHRVPIVEDAACALGASLDGVPAGRWGALGCFSFHPRKAATTGEGGAITTNDGGLLRRIRILRNHGQDPDSAEVDFVEPGFNYRLSEVQAAVGSSQLQKLDRFISTRRTHAASYDRLLERVPVVVPRSLVPSAHVYQSYVVLLPAELAAQRKGFIARLRDLGVETTIGTYHMPLLSYYRKAYGFKPGDFPVSESVAARALALPMHSKLSHADVTTVVEAAAPCCEPEQFSSRQG